MIDLINLGGVDCVFAVASEHLAKMFVVVFAVDDEDVHAVKTVFLDEIARFVGDDVSCHGLAHGGSPWLWTGTNGLELTTL